MAKRKLTSKNIENENYITEECDLTFALSMLSGRWKLLILCHLMDGTFRYSELKEKIPAISEKMLTQQLRELEKDLLVERTVYPEFPPHVDYKLTEISKLLIPAWNIMEEWGNIYRNKITND